MLIHINGMPGVGKLTVARMLAETLGMHLIDNHSLINAAYAAGYAHDSEGYLRTLSEVTSIVYRELAVNREVPHIILTNSLAADCDPDPSRFAAVEQLALDRKEAFVPVLLTCSQEENQRRIVSPDRRNKQKLMDVTRLASFYQLYTMIHPVDHPHQLELDTTSLSIQQTVLAISSHVRGYLAPPATAHPQEQRQRHP